MSQIDGFDFSFNPRIPRDRVHQLATCRFIAEARDVLLVGPPGTGKSHLAQALGREAIRRRHTVYYRPIMGRVAKSRIGFDGACGTLCSSLGARFVGDFSLRSGCSGTNSSLDSVHPRRII